VYGLIYAYVIGWH